MPDPYSDPYRMIGWAWITVLAIWVVASVSSKRTVRRQSTGSRLVQLALGVFAGFLIWGGGQWGGVFSEQVIARSQTNGSVALVVTLAGLALALWARFVLGRNWSATVTIKRDHELVRSGPYAIVRHPIYSGFLLALLGTAIARGTILGFAGVAIAGLVFHFKSLNEESFMIEQFGAQYTVYKREVKALVPFVW